MAYFTDQEFDSLVFRESPLEVGEYDNCVFRNSDLSDADLADFRFLDCRFEDCNWSNAAIQRVVMQQVRFKNCKMLGLHFEDVKPLGFEVSFETCQLDHSSFFRMDLSSCSFDSCQMTGVDLTEANVEGIQLTNCQFADATFDGTNLKKADLRGSLNIRLDLDANQVRGARFSPEGVKGLLEKYGIVVE